MAARFPKRFLAMGLFIFMANCGDLFDFSMPAAETTKKVTIKGTVAIPDGPSDVVVLNNTSHMAWYWFSCPKDGNRSNLAGGTFTLETTNNCIDAQYAYFYDDKAGPRDLKAYANGKITFKIQINSANGGLSFLIQDANATVSNTVNLASFGFDSSKVAVEQLISIPVTAVANALFDLSKVDRLFQLNATCPVSACLITLKEIKWSPPDALVMQSPLDDRPTFSPLRLGRIPHCDPFPCRRLPKANVGIMKPSANGWTAEPAVRSTTTDADGNFTLQVDVDDLAGEGPVFIAVSDADGSFTLVSTIPDDLIKESATIELPVDRTTTAVGMVTCLNGMTIPADGSGGTCIGDPISSSELETLYPTVTDALDSTSSPDFKVFLPDVVDNVAAFAAINAFLSANGEATVTVEVILEANGNTSFPIILPPPTTTRGTTTGTGTVAGAQCQAAIACEVCSITACASAGADASSCTAWYDTSDGGKYACTSCSDCNSAAKAATDHCCPPPP